MWVRNLSSATALIKTLKVKPPVHDPRDTPWWNPSRDLISGSGSGLCGAGRPSRLLRRPSGLGSRPTVLPHSVPNRRLVVGVTTDGMSTAPLFYSRRRLLYQLEGSRVIRTGPKSLSPVWVRDFIGGFSFVKPLLTSRYPDGGLPGVEVFGT